MTIFKTIYSNKTDGKPKSFWIQGLLTSLSLCISTAIYGYITDTSSSIMFERMFFQTFSIMFFCFTMSRTYKIYSKEEKIEHQVEVQSEVKKESQYTF